MIILIVKEAWSEGLWRRSGKIECLSISRELAYKNMRSITEMESLGLSVYQVGTWMLEIDNLRSKEFTMSISMSVWIKW